MLGTVASVGARSFHRIPLICINIRHITRRIAFSAAQDTDDGQNIAAAAAASSPLPITAFIDLDNVAPHIHRRSNIIAFLEPLHEFARRVNQNAFPQKDNNNLNILAFGNLSTRSWQSNLEKERIKNVHQEYVQFNKAENTNTVQTGYDKHGVLRCGVCGRKIERTKREKERGMDELDKLKAHMKVHKREQAKLRSKINNVKSKKRRDSLRAKHNDRIEKFNSAIVGIGGSKIMGVDDAGRLKLRKRNDLFQVLKECGVETRAADNVDAAIMRAAKKWMDGICKRARRRNKSKEASQGEKGADSDKDEAERVTGHYNGILVIYSKDSDFNPLMSNAKTRGFLTVTVTNEATQTSSLLKNSDMAMGRFDVGRWIARDNNEPEEELEEEEGSMNNTLESAALEGFVVKPLASSSPLTPASSMSKKGNKVQVMPLSSEGIKFITERLKARDGSRAEEWLTLCDGHDVETEADEVFPLTRRRDLQSQHLTGQFRARAGHVRSDKAVE